MRIFTLGQLLWQSSLITAVVGFPDLHGASSGHQGLHKKCPFAEIPQGAAAKHNKRFLFDSMKSPIDSKCQGNRQHDHKFNSMKLVTGDHEFQPPNFENGDQRGPCPGLNALANHAYIPRSGVVSVSLILPL
jgi:hypothetical protein